MEELDVTETAIKQKKSKTTKTTKTTKKPAAKRKSTAATTTRAPTKATLIKVSDEERLSMIAETAYFKAEKRGFVGGNPEEDWLAAESEVDAVLANKPSQIASA